MDTIINFLISRNWIYNECSQCRKIFFTKKPLDNCSWRGCSSDAFKFRKKPKTTKNKSLDDIINIIKKNFYSYHFKNEDPLNIESKVGDTDLIGAAVQVINPILFESSEISPKNSLIFQPSIRAQHLKKADDFFEIEGLSTSFVNVATVSTVLDIQKHLEIIDRWLTTFSYCGLYMGDFSLVLREKKNNNWGTGGFHSIELFFNYIDLEIGDASYFKINTNKGHNFSVSDIGFGLERIYWAIRKTDSYSDILEPPSKLGLNSKLQDIVRTLVLMKMNNVSLGNKGAGLYLKNLIKYSLLQLHNNLSYCDINYYCNYWGKFLVSNKSPIEILIQIQNDIDSIFVNLSRKKYGLSPILKGETINEFYDRMIIENKLSEKEIKALLK